MSTPPIPEAAAKIKRGEKPSMLCYAIVALSALTAAENMHDLWSSRLDDKVLTVKHARQIVAIVLSLVVTFLMFVHCCQCNAEMYFWILAAISGVLGMILSREECKECRRSTPA